MRPINAKTYRISGENRLTVADQFLPPWVDRDQGVPVVHCVPLIWTRDIELPEGRELEAWYVWNGLEETGDWRVSPSILLHGSLDTPRARDLAAVVFEGSIEATSRKYRMSCPGLFASLRELGSHRMWITAEMQSFALWTDFAYQAWHGKLALEG